MRRVSCRKGRKKTCSIEGFVKMKTQTSANSITKSKMLACYVFAKNLLNLIVICQAERLKS